MCAVSSLGKEEQLRSGEVILATDAARLGLGTLPSTPPAPWTARVLPPQDPGLIRPQWRRKDAGYADWPPCAPTWTRTALPLAAHLPRLSPVGAKDQAAMGEPTMKRPEHLWDREEGCVLSMKTASKPLDPGGDWGGGVLSVHWFHRRVIEYGSKKQDVAHGIKFESNALDFPGGPGSKSPSSQCRGPRFNPWSGN